MAKEQGNAAPIQRQRQPPPEILAQRAVEESHQARDNHRDRPLGQEAQAHGGKSEIQVFAFAKAQEQVGAEQRGADQQVEQRIGGGHLDDDGNRQRAGGDDPRCQRLPGTGSAAHEQIGQDHPAAAGQGGGQAEGEFVDAEQGSAGRLQPVDQDRLVVARLAVERGGQIVAARQHLARGLAESALVEIEQGKAADAEKEAAEHGDGEQGVVGERNGARKIWQVRLDEFSG